MSIAVLFAGLLAAAPAASPDAGAAAPKAAAAPAPDRPTPSLPYSPSLDLTSLDRAADPCVDFYQFTCGGWIKNNPIPPDRPRWSVYGKLNQDNLRYLWGILEQAGDASKPRDANTQKVGDYFKACMDEAAIEKKGGAPLAPLLAEIDALTLADLPAFLGRRHPGETTGDLLFAVSSAQDFGNSARVIAFAYPGGLGLPDRDYYVKEDERSKDIRKEYLGHVSRAMQQLGEDDKTAEADAKAIIALETALAKASFTMVEKRDPHNLHHLMKAAQVKAMTPRFDWTAYFKAMGQEPYAEVNVTEPKFFKELDAQLKATPLPVWKAYLKWHTLRPRAQYLSKAYVDPDFEFFQKKLRGVNQQKPRWKKCVEWLDRDLGEALGQEFVKRTFAPEVKERTVAMTRQIEDAMKEDIQSLGWMSPATKKRALEKLAAIVNKVGYPDVWRDYSSVEVKPDDFAGNVERAATFESKRLLAKIGKPVDRGEWLMTPPTVNAYYDAQLNDINFPAGVLQPPLFDFKLDDAPNYGNTGSTIGHELTHGFDDEGRQFDAKGNLADWWTPKDAREFVRRAQCVQDQYAQYVIVDDIKINSKLTLGEDVADLGGTVLAYNAWRKATEAQRLKPVDGFTPDQRFFIGFAQWACEDERPENARVNAITNPHSPGRYRINGVVANMPEFKAAFSCKSGQPMVHEPVCRVW